VDLGGKLTDQLLVDSLDHDVLLVGARHLQARRHRLLQLVGKADAQLKHVLLQRGNIANAHDLQPLLVPLRDPLDHIPHQRPRQPVQRPRQPRLAVPADADDLGGGVEDQVDLRAELLLEFAERPFHGNLVPGDGDLHTIRHRHRLLSDSRHI